MKKSKAMELYKQDRELISKKENICFFRFCQIGLCVLLLSNIIWYVNNQFYDFLAHLMALGLSEKVVAKLLMADYVILIGVYCVILVYAVVFFVRTLIEPTWTLTKTERNNLLYSLSYKSLDFSNRLYGKHYIVNYWRVSRQGYFTLDTTSYKEHYTYQLITGFMNKLTFEISKEQYEYLKQHERELVVLDIDTIKFIKDSDNNTDFTSAIENIYNREFSKCKK